jgi:hypothetical protein
VYDEPNKKFAFWWIPRLPNKLSKGSGLNENFTREISELCIKSEELAAIWIG